MIKNILTIWALSLPFLFSFNKPPIKDKITKVKLEFNIMKPSTVVKAGQSHETIEGYFDSTDFNYKITATKNINTYTKTTFNITKKEWNKLQKIIHKTGILQSQKKDFQNNNVSDGSNLMLTFSSSSKSDKRYSWINSNYSSAKGIIEYLAILVKKNIPNIGYMHLLNISLE